MKLTPFEQMMLAGWLSIATCLAVTSRSVSTGFNILVVGTIFTAPLIAQRGLRSPRTGRRWFSIGVLAATGLVMLGSILLMAERLVWTNAASYPRWLVSTEYQTPQDLPNRYSGNLTRSVCDKNVLLELRESADGTTLGRCGFFFHDGPVVLFHFHPLNARQ